MYSQITPEERYTIATLRKQGPAYTPSAIARIMGRHRSTISRELKRNITPHDGYYRPSKAQERTNARRSRSRRNSQFTAKDWKLIDGLLREDVSPEQISGRLEGLLKVSHETIYKHVWSDKHQGGDLHQHLRQAPKRRRKRRGTYEKRGRVTGKRHISERPAAVELRQEIGHWEMDTVIGAGSKDCIVTLVERVTGTTLIGKLRDRSVPVMNKRVLKILRQHPGDFKTITVDNGTEFHGYRRIEKATGVPFYFATPYHSWERGTNENTNGLIRQYLPKRKSMSAVTQPRCNAIAARLNRRPRKRLGFLTPAESMQQRKGLLGDAIPHKLASSKTIGRKIRPRKVSVAVQS